MLVKGAGGKIGFAELEEYRGNRRARKCIESREQERGGDPFAAEIAVNGEIEDFRLVGGLARGHKADDLRVDLAHEQNAAWRVRQIRITFGRPPGGFAGVAQDFRNGRFVRWTEGADFPGN